MQPSCFVQFLVDFTEMFLHALSIASCGNVSSPTWIRLSCEVLIYRCSREFSVLFKARILAVALSKKARLHWECVFCRA